MNQNRDKFEFLISEPFIYKGSDDEKFRGCPRGCPQGKCSQGKLVVILGPTAAGKSKLAIKMAQQFNGEIVSADSRQLYKGMDIATAKPLQNKKLKIKNKKYISKIKNNKIQRPIIIEGVPHYLIDVVYPNQEFNVAIYKKMAIKVIKDIQKRGKLPFLVGGTGLYIQSIVDNIEYPKVPPQKKLRKELEKKSEEELFEIYKKLDPKGAEFIEKENKRRLIRAIEVCRATGKSFWHQRKKGRPLFKMLQIGIKLNKGELEEKIKQRVKKMFQSGLEEEVKTLVKKYGWLPSLQTIGYQEWQRFFEGKIDKKEVEKLIVRHSLQFVKRQMNWFSRDKKIHWLKNQNKARVLIKKFISITN